VYGLLVGVNWEFAQELIIVKERREEWADGRESRHNSAHNKEQRSEGREDIAESTNRRIVSAALAHPPPLHNIPSGRSPPHRRSMNYALGSCYDRKIGM
jgi:hypothetical protein